MVLRHTTDAEAGKTPRVSGIDFSKSDVLDGPLGTQHHITLLWGNKVEVAALQDRTPAPPLVDILFLM